jgi:hypothetical protein
MSRQFASRSISGLLPRSPPLTSTLQIIHLHALQFCLQLGASRLRRSFTLRAEGLVLVQQDLEHQKAAAARTDSKTIRDGSQSSDPNNAARR